MAIVSISDAARLADVTRSTIYDKINSGVLSRTPDGIDTSELARVYPDLKPLENLRLKKVRKRDKEEGSVDDLMLAEQLEEKAKEIEWFKAELAKKDAQIKAQDDFAKTQADRLYEKDDSWQKRMEKMEANYQRLLEAPVPKRKKFLGVF